MSVYTRSCGNRACKRKHYHYYFRLFGKRYRRAVPEARTKWEAEQAESKARQEVIDGVYGRKETGTDLFTDFLDEHYLPYSRDNKRSWKSERYHAVPVREYFAGKRLRDLSPILLERFKRERLATPAVVTKNNPEGRPRAAASVNRELELLRYVYTLAVRLGRADSNPAAEVPLFKLDNERYRYLLPEEEPVLLSHCTSEKKREHLRDMIVFALGTGLRKSEQLSLRRDQIDFARNVVTATRTKSRRNREVPFSPDVRAVLQRLCRGKRPDDFIFTNARTGTRLKDPKRGFAGACRDAGIEGLVWHDLRATFATRLGEAGYNAYTIAALLGHSDIETSRKYVRVTDRTTRAAVEATQLKIAPARESVHVLSTPGVTGVAAKAKVLAAS